MSIGRKVLVVLGASTLLAALAAGVTAVLSNLPADAKACTLAGAIDREGGPTPEAARVGWSEHVAKGVDVADPDEVHRSGDEETAIYLLDRPSGTPGHTRYQQLVTRRDDDGTWRVVDANTCERWRE